MFQTQTKLCWNMLKADLNVATGKSNRQNGKRSLRGLAQSSTRRTFTCSPFALTEPSKMNSRKYTALIRAASLALVAMDCWLLSAYPSPFVAVLVWLLASLALVVAIAPVRSRFSL